MKRIAFDRASFVTTAMNVEGYPLLLDERGKQRPEIAVAGRSNVGKSSLLNHLFRKKNLVKTSSMPGKTQALNFFKVDGTLTFVDLPGYGYARVSKSLRETWGPMIQSYLKEREALKLLLFLFDIRRMPTEDDFALLDWACHAQRATILVLTKIDKVNQSEKESNTKRILEAFGVENLCFTHYSVPKNRGRNELIRLMVDALSDEGCFDVEKETEGELWES